jgi:hypothetical protein
VIFPSATRKDVHPPQDHLAAGGGLSREGGVVGAVGDEVLRHQVALGDQLLQVAAPVRESPAEHRASLSHAFRI